MIGSVWYRPDRRHVRLCARLQPERPVTGLTGFKRYAAGLSIAFHDLLLLVI
jgi:hypothetical protein